MKNLMSIERNVLSSCAQVPEEQLCVDCDSIIPSRSADSARLYGLKGAKAYHAVKIALACSLLRATPAVYAAGALPHVQLFAGLSVQADPAILHAASQ